MVASGMGMKDILVLFYPKQIQNGGGKKLIEHNNVMYSIQKICSSKIGMLL